MVRNYKRKTMDRWSKEDLLEALLCIKEAKLKINDASRQYGISRATLYRQYQKFILAGGKCDVNQFRTCGGNPILTKVEEDVLEKTIRDLREQGFTVTSSDIKRICFEYCDSNGIPNQFNQEKRMASDDWYYGFLKRHPDVRIPKPGGGSGGNTPTLSLSGASGSSPTISAGDIAGALSAAENKPLKTKKAKSSTHKKLLRQEQLVPSHESTVLISTSGEVTTFQDTTYVLETTSNISTPIPPPKGKKSKQAAAIIIPPSSPPLKKSLKRLGGKGTAKRGRKGKPEPSIPVIMKNIVKNEYELEDNDEDASAEDMEDDAEQDDAMEVVGEDSEGDEEAESGAEEEEESGEEEQEEGDETVEVEEDDVEGADDGEGEDETEGGEEETEVGEEDEQEEQDSDEEGEEEEENEEGQDEEEQGEESETAEEQEGEEDEESEEENEEEQEEDSDDDDNDDNVKDEKEDSGSEEEGLLSDFMM